MRLLLDRGANVNAAALTRHEQPENARNDNDAPAPDWIKEETPLSEAAKVGAENICLELIRRGATVWVDSPATSGTPLLYTIWGHLSRLLGELLQRGADPNQRGTVLSAYCPKPTTPLLLAIEQRDISTVHRLMAAGADVNGQDPEGFAPLHRAAAIRNSFHESKDNEDGEDTNIMRALICRYHADVNGPRLLNGSLPIHSAASRGTVEHVQIMLDAGADVNALNNDGRTPKHWAAERGRWDVVELLLDRGADPQIKSTEASLQTA
ncbi:ankyrin repeat protein [Colletotrichum musicola]|uniref:Ankyrin repeat protein n=1 Tax=Colletotrichum musicola TaxID=2175873 RepID=A0A8H6NFE3_9PEZI|nr:ankyrin repeat protein [Colletotrichum musicola]